MIAHTPVASFVRGIAATRGLRLPHVVARAAALALALVASACTSGGPVPSDRASPPQPAFLLLGEVHDNAEGHARRFERLKALVDQGWRPALVLEQFDRDRQDELGRAMSECAQADCVVQRAGGGGWNWTFYRPLIELALRHRLPVLAGNLSRAQAGQVVRSGFGAVFDEATRTRFALDSPLPEALLAGQREAIARGHCGLLPPAAVDPMVRAQVARDVWMALQLLGHRERGAVLIAGNGHVRRDIGVAHWLRQQGMTSIVVEGYLESADTGSDSRFDQVVLVPPVSRPDPCEALRRRPAAPQG